MSRTASEVLLELEIKIDRLIGLSLNQEFLLKNLANRISKLENQPLAQIVTETKQLPSALKKVMPGLKPGIILGNVEGPSAQPVQEIERIYSVNVQQKIIFSDGKPVTMANIELTNDGDFHTLLKTNAGGKWTQSLPPGFYNIKVTKKINGVPKPLEYISKIEIPSVEQIQLDNIKLG